MRPILIELPLPGGWALPFPAYGTFLALGFLAAFFVGRRRVEALGLTSSQLFDFGYWMVIAGVVGAHLGHVILHPQLYFGDGLGAGLWDVLAVWRGGLAYYGGLAGGTAVIVLYARRRRLRVLDLLDFVAPIGALGLAVTRVGCFLNGCCYGRPTGLPWGVRFPAESPPQIDQARSGWVPMDAPSLPVHPTQLYEVAAAIGFFVLLWAMFPRRRFRGQIVLTFFLLYAPWRFAVEFLRADSAAWRPFALDLGPLNVYQVLSLVMFVIAVAIRLRVSRPGPGPIAAAPPPSDS